MSIDKLNELDPNHFDWLATLTITNQNTALAKEIVELFRQELPQITQEIAQAYQAKDSNTLYNLIHKLHGSCCYCVTPTLKGITSQLQVAARQGDWVTIDTLLPRLMQESAHLNKLLVE